MSYSVAQVFVCLFMASVVEAQILLSTDGQARVRARYGYGFTVSWTPEFRDIQLLGPDGTKRWVKNVTIPEVDRVTIIDAAICPDGSVTLATSLLSSVKGIVAANLHLTADGKVERVVRTSPFAAMRLACTVSGKLWLVGRESVGEDFTEAADYDVIRRYDHMGKLEASGVRRSAFGSANVHPGADAFMVADGEDVMLISPAIGRIVSLSAKTLVISSGIVSKPEGCSFISGAAQVGPRIVLSCERMRSEDQQTRGKGLLAVLDRATGQLLRTVDWPEPVAVFGSDASQAVLYQKNPVRLVRAQVD